MDTRTGKLYDSMEQALIESRFEDLIQIDRKSITEDQFLNKLVNLNDDSELAEKARNFKKAKEFNPLEGNRAQRRANAKRSKVKSK